MGRSRLGGWLRTNRRSLETELHGRRQRFFSSATYAQYRIVERLIQNYIRGSVIDLGAGMVPFQPLVESVSGEYHTLDLQPRSDEINLTYVEDIQDMSAVPTGRYDSALCLEVLEHVPQPWQALAEIRRVLTPGGYLVASVPHLSRQHEEPFDFYRYTSHGVRQLLDSNGFDLVEIHRKGGLLSFLGHQVSTLFLTATWGVRPVKHMFYYLNAALLTMPFYALDRVLFRSDIFALGYVFVARAPLAKRTVNEVR